MEKLPVTRWLERRAKSGRKVLRLTPCQLAALFQRQLIRNLRRQGKPAPAPVPDWFRGLYLEAMNKAMSRR